MKILVINSHQEYPIAKGELNKSIQQIIEKSFLDAGHALDRTNIEGGYNAEEEVDKHLVADVIIIQSPVYWFGLPWIGKKYIDEVFTSGLASKKMCVSDGRSRTEPAKQYGTGGMMNGKKFMLSVTWNAPGGAFGDKSQHLMGGKSVDDVFLATGLAYKFCGVEIMPSFAFFDVLKNPNFEQGVVELKSHLKKHFGI